MLIVILCAVATALLVQVACEKEVRTWNDVVNCSIDQLEKCHEKCAPLLDNTPFDRSLLNCELNETKSINEAHRQCLNRNGFSIEATSECWAPYDKDNGTTPEKDLVRRRRSRRLNVGSPSRQNPTLRADDEKLKNLSSSLLVYTNCFTTCSKDNVKFGMCRRGCKHPTDQIRLNAFIKCGVAGRNKGDKTQWEAIYKAIQTTDNCILNELYAHSMQKNSGRKA